MIQEKILTSAVPQKVWSVWKRASYWDNSEPFSEGQYGKATTKKGKGSIFKILNVEEGKSFALEWRAPCVKIEVCHNVEPQESGSLITYDFKLTGFLAMPLSLLLKRRIRGHLQKALKEFKEILEQ